LVSTKDTPSGRAGKLDASDSLDVGLGLSGGGALMRSMALFELSYRQNEWLSQRQSVIASNIANLNTPGFKAKDLVAFDAVMQSEGSLPLVATDVAHMTPVETSLPSFAGQNVHEAVVLHAGNDVSLEQEFLKAGEVMRSYSVNTQIIKAFNRMLLLSTKA
jgi:flagellar basal-body rod protein FlgB